MKFNINQNNVAWKFLRAYSYYLLDKKVDNIFDVDSHMCRNSYNKDMRGKEKVTATDSLEYV